MKEERMPPNELALYLDTLKRALEYVVPSISGGQVEFVGLPVEEWAGPGYAVAALFDPNVLASDLGKSRICLELPEKLPPGITCLEVRNSQKEEITFRISGSRCPRFYLPTMWGSVQWRRLRASSDWKTIAKIAELPAVLAREGAAIFAFNPLKVIHRYLLMADPSSTRDLTDLMVGAVLAASGIERELDDNDLRRDFHAFGVSALLICQMHMAVGRKWDLREALPGLRNAAKSYMKGDYGAAEKSLSALFRLLEKRRREIVAIPIYIMTMPHGGIIIENEGYAEYDWSAAAAKVLNLLLDWTEKLGYRIAPDIGAGTLEEFARTNPETVNRMRKLWDGGLMEFVNGTYSQPYMQLWPEWDQDRQFGAGLKTFMDIFGKRPTVYAAQEIAHHPALPDILVKHGFKHAIHRAQNLGLVPVDKSPIIDWQSPSGTSIRSLPSHPLRTERRGGEIWRHFPILLTSGRNNGLPFIAFTSLMDQTFIDIYNEEMLRANRFARIWGEFVTPSEFFERTKEFQAVKTCYTLDQYHYDLDISGNSIHGHQTGGYSSEHAFMFKESARLQAQEQRGAVSEKELKLLLTQEAHDCYLIPYFAPGYFMEGGLTDYNGPRYRCVNDGPRGIARTIRDAAKYPKEFRDHAPHSAAKADIKGLAISCNGHSARLDRGNGRVVAIDGKRVSLGLLKFDGAPFKAGQLSESKNRLRVSGAIPGYAEATLEYFFGGGCLFCEVTAGTPAFTWPDTKICWGSCVYLEHEKGAGAEIIRTVSGVSQPTGKEKFHSLDILEIRAGKNVLRLRHGGNIFFRQTEKAVMNRLWCYDEFCSRFWWGVEL